MITLIKHATQYHTDPTETFAALCAQRSATLLLESADISKKHQLKSLLLIDSAVRIACHDQTVVLTPLTDNGHLLLSRLVAIQSQQNQIDGTQDAQGVLTLTFTRADALLDEDRRLKSATVFDALRQLLASIQTPNDAAGVPEPFALFVGGLFSYDLVANCEALPPVERVTQCPDYVFFVAETLLVVDHQQQTAVLQGSLFASATELAAPNQRAQAEYQRLIKRLLNIQNQLKTLPPKTDKNMQPHSETVQASLSDAEFCATVERLKKEVVAGNVFQIVPSRRFSLPCPDALAAYRQLKKSNPSPYMFFMQDEAFTLFGASPESALKYTQKTRQVELYPIAGTRPRGKFADGSINLDLDGRLELELRTDKKELAEHIMLVDLARNDLARISDAGTRYVADLLQVDRYSHVMHLVSRVVGRLRGDLDALHAYQACMNMGTLTGAPKIQAMRLIYEVEQTKRGSYGGAVGYLTGAGDLDTCIVIRAAYVENGVASVQAGAGVVLDSIAQSEADETRQKAQAVLSAILNS